MASRWPRLSTVYGVARPKPIFNVPVPCDSPSNMDRGSAAAGIAWAIGAGVLFTVFMYAVAETLASVIAKPEEYVGAVTAVAILPFFFAGALFPIHVLPAALAAFAKLLPLTHALALMRYGFVDHRGSGLHDIWGMSNTTTEAWLSLGVVLLFAAAFIALGIRTFKRSAVS